MENDQHYSLNLLDNDLYTEGYGAALVPVVVLEGLPARPLLGVLHDVLLLRT